jgi:GTP-binding protein
VKELLYHVNDMLSNFTDEVTVFEQEYFPELEAFDTSNEPFTVYYDAEEAEYVIEGPRVERMLGYTNLDSEKGFNFFQNFLKESGILEELEKLEIKDGDTVRIYGHTFDYYK